jgi:5'-nucleotidase
VRRYDGQVVPTTHPLGRELYWFTVKPVDGAEAGTDRWAMEQRWVSLTPLRLDPTDETKLCDAKLTRPLHEAEAAAISAPTSSPGEAARVVDDEAQPTVVAGPPAQPPSGS